MICTLQEEAYLARVKELDDVTNDRDQKRKEHEAMRKQRLDEFMTGFSVITTKLKEMYQVLNDFLSHDYHYLSHAHTIRESYSCRDEKSYPA